MYVKITRTTRIHGRGGNEEEMSWKKRRESACENGTIPMENMLVEVVELKYAGNMGKRSKAKCAAANMRGGAAAELIPQRNPINQCLN
jgi:hypothetical protein